MKIEDIRNRLTDAIRNSGLSQSEIARQINVHHSAVAQYLSGRALPALDTLANLCRVLDVSSDYILGNTQDFGAVQFQSKQNDFTDDEIDLMMKFRAMSYGERKALTDLIDRRAERNKENPGRMA